MKEHGLSVLCSLESLLCPAALPVSLLAFRGLAAAAAAAGGPAAFLFVRTMCTPPEWTWHVGDG